METWRWIREQSVEGKRGETRETEAEKEERPAGCRKAHPRQEFGHRIVKDGTGGKEQDRERRRCE